MATLQQLRASISEPQRTLLDEIWKHFLAQNEWPVAWDFHAPNRKSVVRDALRSLTGSIVVEVPDSQHGSRYQLTLLGTLLTVGGPDLERLLIRYLEYTRMRYQTRRAERMIASSDVQQDLGLDDAETKLVGRLVILGSLYSGSAGHSTNWSSKEWNAGIFQSVEDFPPEGSLNGELEKLLFQYYSADKPVFLEELPGTSSGKGEAAGTADSGNPSTTDPATVFVVHGRNEALRKSMFDFLRAIGLKPLEWSQAISATREATPYIGQVLDAAFSKAQAVVVLMTPDDEASLTKELHAEHDPQYEKSPTGQARPNVLFEAGMAMGRDPKRTVLVEIGILRPFSDVGGRHVLRLDNSSARRQDLADRLRLAGCAVDITGRDWHTVGSFEMKPAKASTSPPAWPGLKDLGGPSDTTLNDTHPNLLPGISPPELEVIAATREDGWIHTVESASYGRMVRGFFKQNDASYQAKYLDAIDSLLAKGLVRPERSGAYRLTGRGFEIKQALRPPTS